MRIKWSKRAELTYNDIIEYLEKKWTKKEVEKFEKQVLKSINNIVFNKYIYPIFKENLNIRKAKVSKQTALFFSADEKSISLLFFWNEYRNPEDLKELLSSSF